jgi:hypothetical protein
MQLPFVLLPLFVQVGLTLALAVMLFMSRRGELVRREVRWQDIALGEPRWSPTGLQRANAFRNQFELPVLFYVLMILLIVTRHADVLMVALAWIFVLSRLMHAYVHVTNNYVPWRGMIFGVGALILLIMWLIFAVRILAGLP